MNTKANADANTNANENANDAIPEIFLEGLSLDVSILDALLKRHRCSHGRTIYFRRMMMTLNRLLRREHDKGGTLRKKIVVADAVYRLKDLQKNIIEYNQEQKLKTTSRKRRHKKEEEKWDLRSLHKTATSVESSQPRLIVQEFQELINVWTGNIPEILSRIQHASKSLFIEVSRGFFLPFCSVALSALARIRSFLMEIGVRGLTNIRNLSDEMLQILPKNDNTHACSLRSMLIDANFERCMNLFIENEDDDNDRKRKFIVQNDFSTQDVMFDRKAILRSLGLMKATRTSSKRSGTLKHDDSDIPTNDNETNNDQKHGAFTFESSADEYHTLSSSAPLEHHSSHAELDDDRNCTLMDDGVNVNSSRMPPKSLDSLDRNMALVNRFQKRKMNEKQSKKKDKKSEALSLEAERKKKKRKPKNKDSSKTKKKKKGKTDFFDQIFD